jgi:transcription elongation factor Elf1
MCQFCKEDPDVITFVCGWCGESHTHLITQTDEEVDLVLMYRDLPPIAKQGALSLIRKGAAVETSPLLAATMEHSERSSDERQTV